MPASAEKQSLKFSI